jgi:imidazolonepropionase
MVRGAAILCVGGKIISIGRTKDALRDPWIKTNRKQILEVDCEGQVVLPGFVDSHTHPVFTVPRLVDFERRVAGGSYEEIAKAGGGIRSSVKGVRQASREDLTDGVLAALQEMAAQGTTTVEAKSGYGLTLESELKSLRALRSGAKHWSGTVVSTLLGAHVLPEEYQGRASKYVDLVCKEMVPTVARSKLAQFVDVFTERGAFTLAETARIFQAARQHGLGRKAHVCQLGPRNLRSLLRFKPASFDHMDHVSDDDIALVARQQTVATLVPGANYFLGLDKYPPARKLIDGGVAVALATDYNPGSSPTTSIPFVTSLACTQMRMSPAESIAAATINGAWALRLQNRKGSIETGKDADMALFAVKDYREVPYWFASSLCRLTVLNGTCEPGCFHRKPAGTKMSPDANPV